MEGGVTVQLSGETIVDDHLSGVIHEETQVEPNRVSLTAAGVYRIETPGQLDFGGGELQVSDREPIPPEKRDSDDDYGWWELAAGTYLLQLNETVQLSAGLVGHLSPHDHLTWGGASHSTLELDEDDSDVRLVVPLSVPDTGLAIKENARVSNLRIFSTGG